MPTTIEEKRRSWVYRRVALPVLGLLRMGASPERLGWSIAIGIMLGINPVIGSTTVLCLAAAFLLRLSVPASQLGTHTAYPIQILLFLPFVHAGSLLFHTEDLYFTRAELSVMGHHPWELTKQIWMWEWHALVVWAGIAVLLTPAIAFLLVRILRRALPGVRHQAVQ